jgi:hypothetical protein
MLAASGLIRQRALGEQLDVLYRDKAYLRELCLAKLRVELGQGLGEEACVRLEKLRLSSSFTCHPVSLGRDATGASAEALARRASAVLERYPASGRGYVQFGSLPKPTRAAVIALRRAAEHTSPGLREARQFYRDVLAQQAAFKGMADGSLAARRFVAEQESELIRRLHNVISKHVGALRPAPVRTRRLSHEAVDTEAGERLGARRPNAAQRSDLPESASVKKPAPGQTRQWPGSPTHPAPWHQAQRTAPVKPRLQSPTPSAMAAADVRFAKSIAPTLPERSQRQLATSISKLRESLHRAAGNPKRLDTAGENALHAATNQVLNAPGAQRTTRTHALALSTAAGQDFTATYQRLLAENIQNTKSLLISQATQGLPPRQAHHVPQLSAETLLALANTLARNHHQPRRTKHPSQRRQPQPYKAPKRQVTKERGLRLGEL